MDCETAQEILWPLATPSVVQEEEERARGHLRRCEACRAFFRRDARLAALLRRSSGEERAPRRLRERIRASLAEESSPRGAGPEVERLSRNGDRAADAGAHGQGELPTDLQRTEPARGSREPSDAGRRTGRPAGHPGSWVRAAVAVLALAIASVVAALRGDGGAAGPDPATLFARDFAHHTRDVELTSAPGTLRHATDGHHLHSSAPEAVARFLEPWVAAGPIRVGLPRGELRGAMICWLAGRPAAVVMYRLEGHPVYHYRYPAGAAAREPAEAAVGSEGPLSGVHVVRWARTGETHALVSDLSASELRRLAGAASDRTQSGRS